VLIHRRTGQDGISIIEILIGLAIAAIVMFVGVPSFTGFLQNTQIRNASEMTLSGINLARAEALRRNTNVRFQFVSSLTSGCVLSGNNLNWVVSLADPTGACDVAPSDTVAPQIVQKQSAQEGTLNVAVATTGGSTIVFNGLGRVTGAGVTQIDFSSANGICEHVSTDGTMRCLRVLVSTGGQPKLCDPKVTAATDPRLCA
jgi:type IV fimbrial biogenesis protein FimT